MDNRTAFWLAILIIAIFVADYFYFEWGLPLVIGKLLVSVMEWIAFWR